MGRRTWVFGAPIICRDKGLGYIAAIAAKTGKKLWHYYMRVGIGAGGCARGQKYLNRIGLLQYAENRGMFALPQRK